LHSACALGNLALVQMLAEVLEVESVDGTLGRTPLMQAVDNDCLEVSKYLLEVKNAQWDVVDENGDNCLHLAARSSDGRLLQLIVSRASTSVDAVNARGETALLCAVKCGRTANVELLLNQGADVTVRDVDERTALDWATANKCKDIADVLQGK
jgi:ankyrin repeat protein